MSADDGDTPFNGLALRSGALVAARFRVLRPLGSPGAYALTYLAQDEREQGLVVLREFLPRSLARREGDAIRPHTESDAQELARAVRRFLREGEILADLSHPALPRVRAAFESNGTAYLAVRHYDAIPLPQQLSLVPDGRLPSARAVELVAPLLEALELVHAEGMLHRDISPQAIFIDSTHGGQPILLSWPAHRHLSGAAARHLTPGFAALEQYGNRGVGPWTDVHACSALLYYLLTGVTPPSAVDRAASQLLAAPSALVPGIPAALSAVIVRGLSQVPEQRPHSVGELRRLITMPVSAPAAAVPSQSSSLAELLSSDRFAAAPSPDAPPRMMDYNEIAATLRLAEGIVVPEESGITGRVKSWLGAWREARQEREATARASSASRRNEPAPPPASPPSPPEPIVREERTTIARRQLLDEQIVDLRPFAEPDAPPAAPPPDSPSAVALREDFAPAAAGPALWADEISRIVEESPAAEAAPSTTTTTSTSTSGRRLPRMQLFHTPTLRGTRVIVGILLVLLFGSIAGGAAWAFREQRTTAQGGAAESSDGANAGAAVNAPSSLVRMAPALVVSPDSGANRVRSESSGALQQGGAERSSANGERRASSDDQEGRRLSSLNVRDVAVRIAAPQSSVLLPAEVDAALRDRLSAGRGLAEMGQYAAARRTFQASLERIDSLASVYGSSQALRTMRETFEKESRDALDACNAENEIRTKRGGKAQQCN